MSLRPTQMEVSTEALRENYIKIAEFAGPACRPIAVVKADGYGHGVGKVTEVLSKAGCQRFAVATADEAVELRENGLADPLLVLGPSPCDAASEFVARDIESACTDGEFAEAMSRAAVDQGKTARVHVKVDTGMGRIGFLPSEAPEKAARIAELPGVELEGLFTHFAVADEADLEYTRLQFSRFCEVLDELRSKGVKVRLRHTCNSAAFVNCPEMHLDAARPGLILYGMWPSKACKRPFDIQPAFRVTTRIAALRELPIGSGVGYGLRYVTRGAERIAVLPVGYADGYPRPLSMKADVLVRGVRAPLVGSICMDQTMVDVTHIPGARVGDEVVLVGSQGDETVSPEEIAALLGTINYEVPNLFTRRVEKVYL